MGGADAWNNTRYIRFDFRVGKTGELPAGRSHLWDKWEGRYRLEQETKDGKTQVVLFDAYKKTGDAYVDGVKLSAEEAAAARRKGAWGVHQRLLLACDAVEMARPRPEFEIDG